MANHERSVRVARGYSQMQLKLLECLANLPRASITPWLHSCNVYHFFNITKRENIYIWLQLSHRYEFMYAVICLRVNKSCFSKTCLCLGKSSYGSQNCNWNSPTQPALKRRVSNYIEDALVFRPFSELLLWMNINKLNNKQRSPFWKNCLKTQMFLYSNEIRFTISA